MLIGKNPFMIMLTAPCRHALLTLALLAAGLGALPAPAQAPAISLVTSKGVGTVYTRPTHAVFRLHETVTGETMEAALKASQDFGTAFREFTVLKELRPTLMEVSTPAIVTLESREVRTSIEIHFSMTPYANGEAGAAKFGALCDQLLAFAGERGCALKKPDFITAEKAAVIQDAVQQASENAIIAAEGAAAALRSSIRAVDTVEIGEVTWNQPPETETSYPTLEQIACTAEVRLSYVLESP